MSRRHGFTLIEIMIAIMIALLMISLAVPGVVGLFRERELKATFESFDDFVHTAQSKSVIEHRGYRLIFDEEGVTLTPTDPSVIDADKDIERFQFDKGHSYTIERPWALVKNPPAEWPFWESGLCEAANIYYTGPSGSWMAEYNPLTVRGMLKDTNVK